MVPELHAEDGVAKVVPIDDDADSAEEADDACDEDGGEGRRRLEEDVRG